MEGPNTTNGMTDMEWLEREQEKEMIELAMERSLNEFQAFQNSQPVLQQQQRGSLRQMHSSMPAIRNSYNDHYAGGSRRDISNHSINHHQQNYQFPQHRQHEGDRVPGRRGTYNTNRPDPYALRRYGGGARQNSLRSLGTPGTSPLHPRPLAPIDFPRSGSFREVQEVTETVIDSPHTSYDRIGGPSTLYHDRRHSSGPLHQRQYDYRSATANAPYNVGRQSPGIDHSRRGSAPTQYHDRGVVPSNNIRPNMRTPRHEARAAVLETARQHLSEEESQRVEEALNLALRSQQPGGRESRQQVHTETQHSNGSSSFGSSHHSHHSRRSADGRRRLSPEEQRHLDEALYASRVDNRHASPSDRRSSSLNTQETMNLLRRASASEHLSQEEMDQIERALEGNDTDQKDNLHYHHARPQHDNYHQPGSPPPPIQEHHHTHTAPPPPPLQLHNAHTPPPPPIQHHHFDRQHEHPHNRHYPPHKHPESAHDRQIQQDQHHDRHHQLDRHSQRDHHRPQEHQDWQEQREVRRVPLPRGYRPNPRFAATTSTPQRTYSGDSLALAKEEIQKAVAANTLSKEEYSELMMALEASNGKRNTIISDEEEDGNDDNRDAADTNVEDDNDSPPTEESENLHQGPHTREPEDNTNHADREALPDSISPERNNRQPIGRSAFFDSLSERHSRQKNNERFSDRSSTLQQESDEGEQLTPVLVVDDAAISYMCQPFPDGDVKTKSWNNETQTDAQQRWQQEDYLSAQKTFEADVGDGEFEGEQGTKGMHSTEEGPQKEGSQHLENSQDLEGVPPKHEEAPRHEEADGEHPEEDGEADYQPLDEHVTSPQRDYAATDLDGSQHPEESVSSSSARMNRRVSERALPPSNRGSYTRLGNSHHSQGHRSQSRHSRRSAPQLSAALAALPYARPAAQGAPGSVSIDLEYSVSQFGDSVATFGSDILGQQKGEGSAGSVISSDTDPSRQNRGSLAFSPPSVSSQTVRGVGLLPPPLEGFTPREEDEGEEDVLREFARPEVDAKRPGAVSATIIGIDQEKLHPENPTPGSTAVSEQLSLVGRAGNTCSAEDEGDQAGLETTEGDSIADERAKHDTEETAGNHRSTIEADNRNEDDEQVENGSGLALQAQDSIQSSELASEERLGSDHSLNDTVERRGGGSPGLNTQEQPGDEKERPNESSLPKVSSREHLGSNLIHEELAEDPEADRHQYQHQPSPAGWVGHREQDVRHGEFEMQDRPSEHKVEKSSDDHRRYGMHHHRDDQLLEEPRASREPFQQDVQDEYYPQNQHHDWPRRRRDVRGEPDRFDAQHWREDHLREQSKMNRERVAQEPERDYFRQRQHHSSRRLGRSESDPYERQRRHGGATRKRRSDSDVAPDVPEQVQVDPQDRREAWAANGRSNSVSSLGESTQYSIYSAHFRSAEDYDRYRNEDYERALYEHNNWRQSHPTPLPHSMRESYQGSDHTGSSRRPQQQHATNHGFRREPDYDRERSRPVEQPVSDHDRFDEDLKRALYESMQMQRSHSQQEDYEDELQGQVDPHEHLLSPEKMDHINRALSGPDHVDDGMPSRFDQFGAPRDGPSQLLADGPSQLPADRFAPAERTTQMDRDMSDPTHNRIALQMQSEAPAGATDASVSDSQAARLIDDALERALQEAKDEEERKSLELARQLQEEDERRSAARAAASAARNRAIRQEAAPQSSDAVRVGAVVSTSPIRGRHPLEAEMSRQQRPSSPTLGQGRSGHDTTMRSREPSRRSLEGSLHQSRSSIVGAVHSSSPERARHPLEESYSSLQQRSNDVGAIRSSSPERARHPLEDSYSSMNQGRTSQVGAVRSSSPDRVRHPLEDSYSSQGRTPQVGAVQSTSPVRAHHPLDESYSSQVSSQRQDRSDRGRQSMDESMRQSSRSNRLDESHGSHYSSRARRSNEDSYSSQITPSLPEGQDEGHASTPPPNDRTLDLVDEYPGHNGVPLEHDMDVSARGNFAAQQDLSTVATPQPQKSLVKDSVSPLSPISPTPQPGKKGKEGRRDSKVLGSVARLGKKGVTSLMQTIKLGSVRKMGSNNSSGGLPGNLPAPPIQQMDVETRIQVDRAISKGVLSQLNGVVKLGREATIFHAEKGPESYGFDVAVKVYKRAQGGGDQSDDSQYDLSQFQNISSKEQLELWTIKEFRNLKRARRAGVPSPLPLLAKNNVLFMQFMGTGGRPAPQLGEMDLPRRHKRWKTLYKQIIEAVRRLFTSALLVHGDLNETNVLVVPRHFIDTTVSSDSKEYDADTAVLIDFGQTVDSKHPDAMDLLRRDLQNLRQFFVKQGVRTPSVDDALQFITSGNVTTTEFNKFDESPNKA